MVRFMARSAFFFGTDFAHHHAIMRDVTRCFHLNGGNGVRYAIQITGQVSKPASLLCFQRSPARMGCFPAWLSELFDNAC